MDKKIAIIGMGHMGKAFYQGLLAGGFKKENISVSNSSVDNKKNVFGADMILLAVKPNLVAEVLLEIKDDLSGKFIISLAAGIPIETMAKQIGNSKQKIIRLMPNLPVAYGQGVIGTYANKNVSDGEKKEMTQVFSQLGSIFDCQKEEELDVITVIAGSGPAIVAYCISMLAKSGQEFGLTKEVAKKISFQTFQGTIDLLKQTNQTAQALQAAVATKGGVTEQIIQRLDKEKIFMRFLKSLGKGYAKIKRIDKELQ